MQVARGFVVPSFRFAGTTELLTLKSLLLMQQHRNKQSSSLVIFLSISATIFKFIIALNDTPIAFQVTWLAVTFMHLIRTFNYAGYRIQVKWTLRSRGKQVHLVGCVNKVRTFVLYTKAQFAI